MKVTEQVINSMSTCYYIRHDVAQNYAKQHYIAFHDITLCSIKIQSPFAISFKLSVNNLCNEISSLEELQSTFCHIIFLYVVIKDFHTKTRGALEIFNYSLTIMIQQGR